MAGLTRREREVVRAVGTGSTNRGIAQRLGISETTVKYHLTNVYRKLGVRTRLELYAKSLEGLPGLEAEDGARKVLFLPPPVSE